MALCPIVARSEETLDAPFPTCQLIGAVLTFQNLPPRSFGSEFMADIVDAQTLSDATTLATRYTVF
jgi:hypothetical protein